MVSEFAWLRVATSFNRLFFETPKANDALLFMTILSTDLQALKRRGYNGTPQLSLSCWNVVWFDSSVERIERKYREQRAEQRKTAEERQITEDAKAKALISQPPTPAPAPAAPLPGAFPEMPQTTVSHISSERSMAPPIPDNGPNLAERMLNPFQNFSRMVGFKGIENHSETSLVRNPTPQGATPLGNICRLFARPSPWRSSKNVNLQPPTSIWRLRRVGLSLGTFWETENRCNRWKSPWMRDTVTYRVGRKTFYISERLGP